VIDARLPPHDITAEQAVLGGMMLSEGVIPGVYNVIGEQANLFFRPAHQLIYGAIIAVFDVGKTPDAVLVADELTRRGQLQRIGGAPYLIQLTRTPPVAESAHHYALIVAEKARQRRKEELAERLRHAPLDEAHRLVTEWLESDQPAASCTPAKAVELDDLLNAEEGETYDWVIPGFLERGDRLILTGPEGGGKSTFLRQVAIQAASGLHPFTGKHIDPVTVLQVDLENSERQCRRELRPLRLAAGDHYQRGRYKLMARPDGLDLTGQRDVDWLMNLADSVKPELLVIGPIYKMANGNPLEEVAAKPVAVTLDKLRVQYSTALLIEAHAPKTMNGTKRAIEPYGWSGWMRWPEFGIHLAKDGQITPWRGQRDASRHFPAALKRGGEWPWTPLTRERDILWSRIVARCTEAGEQLSERDLAELLGATKSSVHRAITEHRAEWDALAAGGAP